MRRIFAFALLVTLVPVLAAPAAFAAPASQEREEAAHSSPLARWIAGLYERFAHRTGTGPDPTPWAGQAETGPDADPNGNHSERGPGMDPNGNHSERGPDMDPNG